MTIAHIENLELGLSVRTKLNALVDQSNAVGNGGISQLTGDVAAGPGSGSQAATLASILTAGGPIGTSTTLPVISWDAKGRLTAVTSVAITFPSPGLNQLTGDVTAGPGSGSQATTLASILTAGGPIGSPTTVPVISWDAKGRVTAVSSATISGGGGGPAIGGAVTGGTSGSVLFIDASTNLAQNNANFSWDNTNLHLKVGSVATPTGEYWVNNVRALYGVSTVGGTSWFEAGAGNTTLTGALNFGTGDGCLNAITSGDHNTGLGAKALGNITTGSQNIALGSQALWLGSLDSNNIAIGFNAGVTLGNGGAGGGGNVGNVLLGLGALSNASQGYGNICIGYASVANVIGTANQNIIIGSNAGGVLGSSGATVQLNTLIGTNCGSNLTAGSTNVWIGNYKGPSRLQEESIVLSDGTSNTYQMFDFGLTSDAFHGSAYSAWSMSYNFHLIQPVVFHLYNYQNAIGAAMTAHERLSFDLFTTTNVYRIRSEAGGGGIVRLIALDGFAKAGAPAAGDLPSGSFALIDDTSANQTWLCFNKAGTIRKVQLV